MFNLEQNQFDGVVRLILINIRANAGRLDGAGHDT